MTDDSTRTSTPPNPTGGDRRPTIDPAAASAALREAHGLAGSTRLAGLWYARYMQAFGVGFGTMTLLLGLTPEGTDEGFWRSMILIVAWAGFVVAMLLWAVRRPVHGALAARTYVPGWVGTSVLYGLELGLGLRADLPGWAWLLLSVVVAAPLVVAGARLRRAVP